MNNYFNLSIEQQRLVLTTVSARTGLPEQAIEKDLWVTTILQIVFTMPISKYIVFKGGTSLSKVWKLINRFSEDIDLAIDPSIFGLEGEVTKHKIKKLRKQSSLFVREQFCQELIKEISKYPISNLCDIEPEPDGEGNSTYPEPRKILIHYNSVLNSELAYLRPVVQLEIGARSLLEPTTKTKIRSIVEDNTPSIVTTQVDTEVTASIAEKTFLEKVFLLHEMFSVEGHGERADRKSRHMYDLYCMMNKDFAKEAISNDDLWESIRKHREVFTSVKGIDYSPEVRDRLVLIPGNNIIDLWERDYNDMKDSMIYGNKPTFKTILECMEELQNKFKKRS